MSAAKMKHIPALRFPEFTEPWKTGSIDSFVKRYNHPVAVEPDCMYRQIGVRSHGKGIFHKAPVTGKSLGDKRVFWVHPQAFVVNIVFGWEQAVALTSAAEDGFIASHRFPMFVPNESKTDLNFLLLFFLRKKGKYLLELASPGGAGRNKTLGQNEFAKLDVTLPTLPEQQKIATFVGAVDKKLEALRREHELLQTYKSGLMQKIFSQELRFKDEDDGEFPEWENKSLAQLGAMVNGLSGKTADDFGDGKPYVTYKQVFDKSFIDPKDCRFVRIGKDDNQQRLKKGDILFTTSSETPDEVGFASVLLDDLGEVYLNSFCFGLRPHKLEELLPAFSMYLFRSHNYRKSVVVLAQGSTRYNLSKSGFLKLCMKVPHPEEQQKIADFLSAIDAKINAVADQIEKMKQFKKGLLQQMFV